MEQYIATAENALGEDLPLFGVRRQGLSYSRAWEIVKNAFKDILDVSSVSLHSLRAGGAIVAAINAGVNDRLFKGLVVG